MNGALGGIRTKLDDTKFKYILQPLYLLDYCTKSYHMLSSLNDFHVAKYVAKFY